MKTKYYALSAATILSLYFTFLALFIALSKPSPDNGAALGSVGLTFLVYYFYFRYRIQKIFM